MSARGGQLPWTGTAARTRELGYGDAMREVMLLAQTMREQAIQRAAADAADPASRATDAERLALRAMGALAQIETYARTAYMLASYPAVTVEDAHVLGFPLRETARQMLGGAS